MDQDEAVLSERFNKLFEGVEGDKAKALFEELIDEYCDSVYNTSIIGELRKLKRQNNHHCTTIQEIAKRGIMVSQYGFDVISETQHPRGGVQLILRSRTREDHKKEKR